jgi:eukaryotic-like serine/threonine-protein kinase
MALVYRAHDQLLDRIVALKVLFPELSVDPAFVERFRREAQSAAKLSHPNIVPVFDWGEDEGTYFIVMEFVDGQPLSAVLRAEGQLEPLEAAAITSRVADALDYAHRRGVVHRDVKPGNVLLTADGGVKVTDFGIARAVNTEEGLTQAGLVMGTATYFSPEQAEGSVVDARSDVYSLGVVFYEELVGRPPFAGDSPVAVASKHVREVAPLLRTFDASVPIDAEAICMKAMAKHPLDRYQSAGELRDDLDRFCAHEPVLAPDPEVAHAQELNATTTMAAINRTQAVPVFQGPRTDLVRNRGRRGPSPWLWVLVAAVVLALVAGGIALVSTSRSSGPSSVPNLVGLSLAQATAQLRQDGLVLGSVTKEASAKPAGQVLSTNPGVGQPVSAGGTVDLAVSDGSLAVQVALPNVVGKLLPDAIAALQQAGFQVQTQSSNVAPTAQNPANSVLAQSPSSPQAPKGSTVTLTVVGNPAQVNVPSLVGQPADGAAAALAGANLALGTQSTACSSSYGKGLVASTSPAAGSAVAAGTAVNVVVSSGPCTVYVPNPSGQTVAQYNQALSAQGLVGSTSCRQNDTFTATSPAPGTAVAAGSTVSMTGCVPPSTTTTAATSTTSAAAG